MPASWVGDICPTLPGEGCDTGEGKYGFTRDFGAFLAVLIVSTLYFFTFLLIKDKNLCHTDNEVLKIISATYAFLAAEAALGKFGTLGFNPLVSTIIVLFKVS